MPETNDKYIAEINAWIEEGIDKGFCSSVYCSTHDGFAPEDTDAVEVELQDIGFDYCWFVVTIGLQNTTTAVPHLLTYKKKNECLEN